MVASPPADFTDPAGVAWTFARLRPSGFGTYVLADPEAALDDALAREDFDGPYFGTVWPAGRMLADQILDGRVPAAGRVCDLGCGVGVAGLAALAMGADVTFLDVAPYGFPAIQAAAMALALPPPRCVEASWELDTLPDRFDAIVAADVLYHSVARLPVARFVARHLAPEGRFWLADPGRRTAAPFRVDAARLGLQHIDSFEVRDPDSRAVVAISQYGLESTSQA